MAADDRNKGNETSEREGGSWWLYGAGIATLIYLLGAGLVLLPQRSCGNPATDCHLWSRMIDLAPNELGDFLAGIFAPLAFLWLAAAVGIQSQELRAQRRELRLTRKEFELSRTVAEETRNEISQQAEAAEKNAAFVGQQTEILTAQFEEQKQRNADEELSRMLDQLAYFLRNRIGDRALVALPPEGFFSELMKTDGLPENRDDALISMSLRLQERINDLNQMDDNVLLTENTSQLLKRLNVLVSETEHLAEGASSSARAFLQSMGLVDLRTAITVLLFFEVVTEHE